MSFNREDILRQRLAALDEEYKRQAQPLIDELVSLAALKPSVPLFIIDPINKCDHKNSAPTNQFVGNCVIYRCKDCGEEWEKDVS